MCRYGDINAGRAISIRIIAVRNEFIDFDRVIEIDYRNGVWSCVYSAFVILELICVTK